MVAANQHIDKHELPPGASFANGCCQVAKDGKKPLFSELGEHFVLQVGWYRELTRPFIRGEFLILYKRRGEGHGVIERFRMAWTY